MPACPGSLSAFVGAMAITAGGASAYPTLLGSAMFAVLISLAVISHHIPGPKTTLVAFPEVFAAAASD